MVYDSFFYIFFYFRLVHLCIYLIIPDFLHYTDAKAVYSSCKIFSSDAVVFLKSLSQMPFYLWCFTVILPFSAYL